MVNSKSILKLLLLLVLITATTQAKIFLDNDLDGVANEDDKCPNSKITDIVNKDGCAVDKVVFEKEKHIDISISYSQDKIDNSWQTSQNLAIGYYYGDSSFWLTLSKYNSDNSDDLTVAYYRYINKNNYTITLGAGAYIPLSSNSNESTDYFLSVKYAYYFYNSVLSAEYQHTFSKGIGTQDSKALTLQYGYLINKNLYMALSYSLESSIYKGEENSQTVSIYANYHLNTNWYISADLKKELQISSKISYSVTLGYFF